MDNALHGGKFVVARRKTAGTFRENEPAGN